MAQGKPEWLQDEYAKLYGEPAIGFRVSMQGSGVTPRLGGEPQWLQCEHPRLRGKPHRSRMSLHDPKVSMTAL
jgi:hypothetical protein